jgi:23S rRNA pseudouridine1911/1915/1917 synthase
MSDKIDAMKPFRAERSAPLLELLQSRFPEVKRSRLLQYLKHGSIRVNERVVTLHRHAVKAGDAVDFLDKPQAQAKRFQDKTRLNIVFEDETILVADKPAGLLTMATEEERERTLYARLTEYVRLQTGGKGRIFIVHRLDRETSGLVVFAKTAKAKEELQGHWDTAVKTYLAITEGTPWKSEDTIQGYLREDKSRRVWTSKHAMKDSKPASTHYRVLRTQGPYAFLEVMLETGRKNQIRAHLHSINCPVAGDGKYGAQSNPIGRLALHATELSIVHPATGQRMTFRSQPPEEFSYTLSKSR